jgi:hypothetical protein
VTTSSPSPATEDLVNAPDHPTEQRKWIKIALVTDIVIVVALWALLPLGSQGYRLLPINHMVASGVALMLVAFVTFGGFYLASPAMATSRDPWMRNAIAATFVMFYLFLLTLLLASSPLRTAVTGEATPPETITFGERMFNGFSTFVGIVLGFYFATQAAERVTETIQSGQTTRIAIQQQPELARQVLAEQQQATRRGGPPM